MLRARVHLNHRERAPYRAKQHAIWRRYYRAERRGQNIHRAAMRRQAQVDEAWQQWEVTEERMKASILEHQLERLVQVIPKGLPLPTGKLGSGFFGTAYTTDNPRWVLKVTSDCDEVEKMQTAIKYCPDVVVDVLHICERDGFWLLWKEAVSTDKASWPADSADQHKDLRDDLSGAFCGHNDAHGRNIGMHPDSGRLVAFDV